MGPSLRQTTAAVLLLGSLGLATYGRVVDNGYVLDAVSTVQSNRFVRAEASLVEIFSTPYWDPKLFPERGLYRPITVASFHWTRSLWSEPVVSIDHGIDLALHILCGLIFFVFLMQMKSPFGVALSLAAIFILHPVQSETVSNLVGRSDLLAAFFALAALSLSLVSRVPAMLLLPGLFGLFLLSLLSKESAAGLIVILPACWAARELWQGASRHEIGRGAFKILLGLSLAFVCYLALRHRAIGGLLVNEFPSYEDGRSDFFELRWRALAFMSLYAQKLVWPLPLLPDYVTGVVPVEGFEFHARALFSALVMSGSVIWSGWSLWRHQRLSQAQIGLLCFWIAVAPVSNLIFQIGAPFGERFYYFPLVFVLFAIGGLPLWRPAEEWGLVAVPRLWPVWIAAAVAFGVVSFNRVPEWRSNRALFRAAAADGPGNYKMQVDYGTLLFRNTRSPEDRENSRKAYAMAATIRPDAYTPQSALGVLATLDGDLEAARSYFKEAYHRVDRVDDVLHETAAINLAHTYRKLKQFSEMEAFAVPLARAHPGWSRLRGELVDFWWTQERFPEALALLEGDLAREPENKKTWRRVIEIHLRLGQRELAAERLEEAPKGTSGLLFEMRLKAAGLSLPGSGD